MCLNYWKSGKQRCHIQPQNGLVRGWSGGAKVLCILDHRGVQLILAYSWARPAILVVGKGRGGMFLFLLFLHFHSCSSFFPVPLFHLLYSLFYLFSPFLWETTQNDPKGWRVVKPQHNGLVQRLGQVWYGKELKVQLNFNGSNIFETMKICSDTGSLSQLGLILVAGQKANEHNLGMSISAPARIWGQRDAHHENMPI